MSNAEWLGIGKDFCKQIENELIALHIPPVKASTFAMKIWEYIAGVRDFSLQDKLNRYNLDENKQLIELLLSKIQYLSQEISNLTHFRVNEKVVEKDLERQALLLDVLIAGDQKQIEKHRAAFEAVVQETMQEDGEEEEGTLTLSHIVINGLSHVQPNPVTLYFRQSTSQEDKTLAAQKLIEILKTGPAETIERNS